MKNEATSCVPFHYKAFLGALFRLMSTTGCVCHVSDKKEILDISGIVKVKNLAVSTNR